MGPAAYSGAAWTIRKGSREVALVLDVGHPRDRTVVRKVDVQQEISITHRPIHHVGVIWRASLSLPYPGRQKAHSHSQRSESRGRAQQSCAAFHLQPPGEEAT